MGWSYPAHCQQLSSISTLAIFPLRLTKVDIASFVSRCPLGTYKMPTFRVNLDHFFYLD